MAFAMIFVRCFAGDASHSFLGWSVSSISVEGGDWIEQCWYGSVCHRWNRRERALYDGGAGPSFRWRRTLPPCLTLRNLCKRLRALSLNVKSTGLPSLRELAKPVDADHRASTVTYSYIARI